LGETVCALSLHGSEAKCAQFYYENLKKGNHLGGLGVEGKIILKGILTNLCRAVGTGFNSLKTGPLARCSVHCNELFHFIKFR
jgi:hypothetical protein